MIDDFAVCLKKTNNSKIWLKGWNCGTILTRNIRRCSKVGRNHHKMFVKHKIILFGIMALFLATLELYLYILKAVEAAACTAGAAW
jgi:hypothetical protein